MAVATLGGGCFWCIEAVFQLTRGVSKVRSGYAGGRSSNPSYEEVCSGSSGHAEVVQVEFDPSKLQYSDLLKVFFAAHDPTTLNRQGADVGTQYRSAIFYHNEEQKTVAESVKAAEQQNFSAPIVTQIAKLDKFYPAEDYHQNYYNLHNSQGYCVGVIRPKIQKLKKEGIIA